MWIYTKEGFVSAVRYKQEDRRERATLDLVELVIVRARRREHLQKLFPEHEIHETPEADYAFRVFVVQEEFATVLFNLALDIDYPNFKNSVPEGDYHDCLNEIWFETRRILQDGRLHCMATADGKVFCTFPPGHAGEHGTGGIRWPRY